ncbi:MAG: helix-turn-helix domain-containing protein [Deltaproteobacteria bacterium]|jgi:excisionase family DNA binding protein|nr:helix-turn-helix domain-containing protein [Deltaproteobacteria bacterium]
MARTRQFTDPPLSSREVAVLLDLGPDEVNELARRGELPAFKQGRFWRFRRADVLRLKDAFGLATPLLALSA